MQSTLSASWRWVKRVYIKAINPNLFFFKFFHELDLQRVRNLGPWTLDLGPRKDIERCKGGRDPRLVENFNIARKGLHDLLAQQ